LHSSRCAQHATQTAQAASWFQAASITSEHQSAAGSTCIAAGCSMACVQRHPARVSACYRGNHQASSATFPGEMHSTRMKLSRVSKTGQSAETRTSCCIQVWFIPLTALVQIAGSMLHEGPPFGAAVRKRVAACAICWPLGVVAFFWAAVLCGASVTEQGWSTGHFAALMSSFVVRRPPLSVAQTLWSLAAIK
jgi:hypothetical protein